MMNIEDTKAYRHCLKIRAEIAEEKAQKLYARIKRAEWALDNCEASARRNLTDDKLEAVLTVIEFTRDCLAPMGEE